MGSIRNLRREVDVYKSNTAENLSLKADLMKRLKELSVEGQERWANIGQRVTKTERRELLELVVQTHTLELENMELELQLRLKDKVIADLQREMEQLRSTMLRHGMLDEDWVVNGSEAGPLSERSNTVEPHEESASHGGEAEEETAELQAIIEEVLPQAT